MSTPKASLKKTQTDNKYQNKRREQNTNPIFTPASLQSKYIFLNEIGHGTQAKVFQALRISDQKPVAIKQLNIHSVKSWKEYELFDREAQTLESLNIPGVAKFYEAIECLDDEVPCSYIVQEFIEGVSLANLIKNQHRFRVVEVYEILIQLLQILQKLQEHDPPIIHRDIKPSNIMMTPTSDGRFQITLIDFGAVANPQIQGGGSTLAGTFGYMPPEQLMQNPVPASDIYALAAVAVELFTGKSPAVIPSKDFRMIFEPEMEQMRPELVQTLRKMLEPKYQERLCDIPTLIQTFQEFKSDIYQIREKALALPKDINSKLERVNGIGDAGNMDIWQALPDKTPREVPASLVSYYNTQKSLADSDKNTEALPEEPLNHHLEFSVKFILENLHAFCSYLVVYLNVLLPALAIISALVFIAFFSLPALIVSVICLIGSVIFDGISRRSETKISSELQAFNDSIKLHSQEIPHGLFEAFVALMKYGRKSIATITDIQYCPVTQIEQIQTNNLERLGCTHVVNERPSFRVRYKFNPPDDLFDNDLIHECIVYDAPEGRYSVGDPLPIIYYLVDDYYSQSVLSMIFPFPLESPNSLKDIICTKDLNKMNIEQMKITESSFGYKECFLPLCHPDDFDKTLDDILRDLPKVNDYIVIKLIINAINNLFSTHYHKDCSRIADAICEIIYNRGQKISLAGILYNKFFLYYFNQNKMSPNPHVVEGILSFRCASKLPDELWKSLIYSAPVSNLYKSSFVDYRWIEKFPRFPMRMVRLLWEDPLERFEDTDIINAFGAWVSILYRRDAQRQKEYLEAFIDFSSVLLDDNYKHKFTKPAFQYFNSGYPVIRECVNFIPRLFWYEFLEDIEHIFSLWDRIFLNEKIEERIKYYDRSIKISTDLLKNGMKYKVSNEKKSKNEGVKENKNRFTFQLVWSLIEKTRECISELPDDFSNALREYYMNMNQRTKDFIYTTLSQSGDKRISADILS